MRSSGPMLPAGGQGGGKLRPVVPLAALDLCELGDQLAGGCRYAIAHRSLLRLEGPFGLRLVTTALACAAPWSRGAE
jgi:hypothetical protein